MCVQIQPGEGLNTHLIQRVCDTRFLCILAPTGIYTSNKDPISHGGTMLRAVCSTPLSSSLLGAPGTSALPCLSRSPFTSTLPSTSASISTTQVMSSSSIFGLGGVHTAQGPGPCDPREVMPDPHTNTLLPSQLAWPPPSQSTSLRPRSQNNHQWDSASFP